MKNITRRKLLTTSALGAAAVAIGAQSVSAMTSMTGIIERGHDVATCAHNHHALGHKLSTLIADPAVDDSVKNHAIKTSVCPTCGTGIAPTGLGLAVHSWSQSAYL